MFCFLCGVVSELGDWVRDSAIPVQGTTDLVGPLLLRGLRFVENRRNFLDINVKERSVKRPVRHDLHVGHFKFLPECFLVFVEAGAFILVFHFHYNLGEVRFQ